MPNINNQALKMVLDRGGKKEGLREKDIYGGEREGWRREGRMGGNIRGEKGKDGGT